MMNEWRPLQMCKCDWDVDQHLVELQGKISVAGLDEDIFELAGQNQDYVDGYVAYLLSHQRENA
jgi:hypothetical protein